MWLLARAAYRTVVLVLAGTRLTVSGVQSYAGTMVCYHCTNNYDVIFQIMLGACHDDNMVELQVHLVGQVVCLSLPNRYHNVLHSSLDKQCLLRHET